MMPLLFFSAGQLELEISTQKQLLSARDIELVTVKNEVPVAILAKSIDILSFFANFVSRHIFFVKNPYLM